MKITTKKAYSGERNLPSEAKNTGQGIKKIEEQVVIELTTDKEICEFMDAPCGTIFEKAKLMLKEQLLEAERVHKDTKGVIKNADPIKYFKNALNAMKEDTFTIMVEGERRQMTEGAKLGIVVQNVIIGMKEMNKIYDEAYESRIKKRLNNEKSKDAQLAQNPLLKFYKAKKKENPTLTHESIARKFRKENPGIYKNNDSAKAALGRIVKRAEELGIITP